MTDSYIELLIVSINFATIQGLHSRGFKGQGEDVTRKNRPLVLHRALKERLLAWHGHHMGCNANLEKLLRGINADNNFGTGCDENQIRIIAQNISIRSSWSIFNARPFECFDS
jgi:hypothetical protein